MPKNPWLDNEAWGWKVPKRIILLITIVLACLALFGIMGA